MTAKPDCKAAYTEAHETESLISGTARRMKDAS